MGSFFSKRKNILDSHYIKNDILFEPLVDENNILERVNNLENNVKLISEDLHTLNTYILNHQLSSK